MATLKHVFGGECSGLPAEERKEAMSAIKEQMTRAMKAMRGAYKQGGGGGRCHETIARAYAGAVMASKGVGMGDRHWEALRQFACGCLPAWEAVSTKEGGKARTVVMESIDGVQGVMAAMVSKWRERAAGGVEWERERMDKGEWMRLVLRAWKHETCVEERADSEADTSRSDADNEAALPGRGEHAHGGESRDTNRAKRRRAAHGRRAAANATAVAKYVVHVVRQSEAARSSPLGATDSSGSGAEVRRDEPWAGAAAAGARAVVAEEVEVTKTGLESNKERLLSMLRAGVAERMAAREQERHVGKAVGYGRQAGLRLGVNIGVTLGRNERLGRSWRGSWEVG